MSSYLVEVVEINPDPHPNAVHPIGAFLEHSRADADRRAAELMSKCLEHGLHRSTRKRIEHAHTMAVTHLWRWQLTGPVSSDLPVDEKKYWVRIIESEADGRHEVVAMLPIVESGT